jgi:hypothetical protein
LKDEDWSVRGTAASGLKKIGDQIKDIATLKDIVAGLFLASEWEHLEIVTNRLETLQAGQRPLPDPLSEPPVSSWQRSSARFRLWVIWLVVDVILGLILLISAVLGDLLKAQWTTTLQTWAATHLGALIGVFIVLLLIGGLLTLGLAALQDLLKKK